MKKSIITLTVASAILISALAPATVSAGQHMSMHSSKMNTIQKFLMEQGYTMSTQTPDERRMTIMKFQKSQGLMETGNINLVTSRKIRELSKLPTIVGAAVATDALSTLVAAVKAGGLVDALSSAGPFTVFAPTNDAFAKVPSATLASLLTAEGKPALVNILTYHVVSGKAMSGDLVDGQEIKTLQGKTLKVMIKDGNVYINGAQVVIADVKTKNGVVHVIDTVLMP